MTTKQILQEQADDLIVCMRQRLIERLPKTSIPSGAKYESRTNATSNLFRALRSTVEGTDENATLTIAGTGYWRAADQGSPPGTRVSADRILKWARAKGVMPVRARQQRSKIAKALAKIDLAEAQKIANKIFEYGTNPVPSNFFTKYRDDWSRQTIDRLLSIDFAQQTIEETIRIKDVELTVNISS
jgi:hypothetical protein